MSKTESNDLTAENAAITVDQAVSAYQALRNLHISKLKRDDVFKFVHISNALKKVANEFDDLVKDAQNQLKPEGWDALVEKSRDFEKLSVREREAFTEVRDKYNKDVNDCVQSALGKPAKLEEYEHLSSEALCDLIIANEGLTVDSIMLLQHVIG